MLGFRPKLPVSEDERQWLDEGFRRLERKLGRRRMIEAQVILPTAEHFPDAYDATPASAETLFQRVCEYMDVDRQLVEFQIFPDETEELRTMLPSWSSNSSRCAGLYIHGRGGNSGEDDGMVIAIRSTQLKAPMSLVATMAHELGHVILLGGGLMDRRTPDHEPMTDLLTVYLGLGIFTANSAASFRQFQDARSQGWTTQRLGYIPEEAYGYALAKFAAERGEDKPVWSRHLSANVREYFKRSGNWLKENTPQIIRPDPIG